MNKITRISTKLTIIITLLLLSIGKSSNLDAIPDCNSDDFFLNQHDIEATYQDVRIDFRSLDEIYIVEELKFKNLQNNSITELEFWPSLNLDFRNINAEDDAFNPISLIPNEFERFVTLYFDTDIGVNQSYVVRINYYLDVSLDPYGKKSPYYFHFQYTPVLTYFTQKYNVSIGLPTNCWLHEDEIVQQPFYPTNGSYNPSGSRIYLYWSFNSIKPDSDLLIYVWFNEPPDTRNPFWPYIVGPLCGVLVGAAGVYWWMKKNETRVMKEVGKIFLTEDQKQILNLIIESEGKITQKELIEKTGFTKSKISRNLTPLENNELITKERWGREYKVYITERGRKVAE